MKKTVILLALLFPLALLSCTTGTGRGSWKTYPELPVYWDLRPGIIEVTVDQAPEESIAAQFGVIAETLLTPKNASEVENTLHYLVDIKVEQRSFLHGTELMNTIYLGCLIRGENGNTLGREYEYVIGRRSIVSAREQHRLLSRVLKRMLREQRNRYRKILQQRKKVPHEA